MFVMPPIWGEKYNFAKNDDALQTKNLGHVGIDCVGRSPLSGAILSLFPIWNSKLVSLVDTVEEWYWLCFYIPIFLSAGETNANSMPFVLIKFSHRIPWPSSLFPILMSLLGISFFTSSTFQLCQQNHISYIIINTQSSNHQIIMIVHICSIGKNATLSCEFDQDPAFCAFINPDGD